MKKAIFALLLLSANQLFSQAIFEKITNSPVTTMQSDSRSVNWIDADSDGDLDLFISNGKQGGENNFLYLNDGLGSFALLENSPITSDGEPSDGSTWADYDNDGDADCYVANWYDRNNLLYRNDGLTNGLPVFSRILTGAIATDGGFSEDAAWGDYNQDGWLDLYVSNSDGTRRNFLYKNSANGTFQRVITSPAATDAFTSRGVIWTDFDMDNDLDLFVCNENGENENFYENDSSVFVRLSGGDLLTSGGKTMSASWADYDNDGFLDIFLANDGGNDALFHNVGDGTFTKIVNSPVVTSGGNSFGSQFADVNNDGWLDLFVTNAFWGGQWSNFLFINQGNGTFLRNTTEAVATDLGWSYGCAFGDMDSDGDLDLAVANCYSATQENSLYKNLASENGNKWLQVQLQGTTSNRDGIGAKVWVTANVGGHPPLTQLREISSKTGHCGQNQIAAHFGLGNLVGDVQTLRVNWPSGLEEVFEHISPNQLVKIVEGQGITSVKNPVLAIPNLRLFAPMPNPFSDSVTCHFELSKSASLKIEIIDNQGIVKHILANEKFDTGEHILNWQAEGLENGVCFLRFSGEKGVVSRRILFFYENKYGTLIGLIFTDFFILS